MFAKREESIYAITNGYCAVSVRRNKASPIVALPIATYGLAGLAKLLAAPQVAGFVGGGDADAGDDSHASPQAVVTKLGATGWLGFIADFKQAVGGVPLVTANAVIAEVAVGVVAIGQVVGTADLVGAVDAQVGSGCRRGQCA